MDFMNRYQKYFKVIVVGELALFIPVYYGYHKMNHDPEFRYYARDKYPKWLDRYYQLGEKMDKKYQGRILDLAYFAQKDAEKQALPATASATPASTVAAPVPPSISTRVLPNQSGNLPAGAYGSGKPPSAASARN